MSWLAGLLPAVVGARSVQCLGAFMLRPVSTAMTTPEYWHHTQPTFFCYICLVPLPPAGVAEILGGLGMCLGALPFDSIPNWLCPTSALGLFFLTAAVTPANIYMYTHNAPGPLPESAAPGALPWPFHVFRGVMQMVLLAVLWGIATASR